MAVRDDLEASLRARPDDPATLAVYADLLQAQGDPRGELIALDLRPPAMSTHGIENRRGQLLATWLGDDIDLQYDADRHQWFAGDLAGTHATFDCGFIDIVAEPAHVYTRTVSVEAGTWQVDEVLVARLLAGKGGDYVRRISINGSSDVLTPMLAGIGARKRPWLQHLALRRPLGDRSVLRELTRLVAATPNLEVLDLHGRGMLDRFTHPNLRELGVTGCEAIDLIEGAPFPALHTLDFALDGDRPVPAKVFSPDRLPALRRLIVARDEPASPELFATLGRMAVAGQLTHLVVPSLRTPRHVALLQAAIDRMPVLRELQIARVYSCFREVGEPRHGWAKVRVPAAWPWPPAENLVDRMLVIDGYSTDLHDIVEVLEEQYDELPEPQRAIWYRFWSTVDALAGEQAFSVSDLVEALEPLVLTKHLDSLRDHLETRLRQRGPFHAAMHWD